MTHSEIKSKFRKAFNGQTNFMTPNVMEYDIKGNYIYELSKGKGIFGNTIYGVTVLTLEGEKTDLNAGGFGLKDARNHINSLS